MAFFGEGGFIDNLYWSPEECAELATKLSKLAADAEVSIQAVYKVIDNLGTSKAWIGKLFNDLAEEMNTNAETFEYNIRVLGEEIPQALNESAESQAEASQGSFASFSMVTISGGYKINLTDDDGKGTLIFNGEEVTRANEEFLTKMQESIDILNQYKTQFDELINFGLSSKAQAFDRYREIVEGAIAQSTQRFEDFADKFVDQAKASMSAIETADSESAAKADKISGTK